MQQKWIQIGAVLLALAATAQTAPVTSKFDVEVYGFVKLDAVYDSHRTAVGDLAFFALPKTDGQDDGEFRFTARQTRLGLRIKGPEVEGGKLSGVIEMDFYGYADRDNAYHPRMRLGYLDWAFESWSLRAGQDWEAFLLAVPNTINFATMADHGALGLRRPQVRLTKDIPLADGFKIISRAAVARTVGQDLDGGGRDDGVDAEIPTFQGALALSGKLLTEKSTLIGVSGHWGKEEVDWELADESGVDEEKYDTWSVIGSANIPILDQLSIVGTVWTGENLDTYFGGIGQGINAAQKKSIQASGGWVQAQIFPMDKVNINLGYGLDNPKAGDLSKGMRSRNETIMANVHYHFSPELSVGFEYQYLKTEYEQATDVEVNRFQGAMTFKF